MTSVAVIDVETTGLNPNAHDRIVEVGAVVLSLDGKLLRQFVTLVNPDRDMGPTRIHGLSTRDVLPAPRFGDLAGALVQVLDGTVALAGHNVRFDHSFLAAESGRLGYAFPCGPLLCTNQLAGGGRLSRLCEDYGIQPAGTAHNALSDARATGELLLELLADAARKAAELLRCPPIRWPDIPPHPVTPVTRSDSGRAQAAPRTYLERLLDRMPEAPPLTRMIRRR